MWLQHSVTFNRWCELNADRNGGSKEPLQNQHQRSKKMCHWDSLTPGVIGFTLYPQSSITAETQDQFVLHAAGLYGICFFWNVRSRLLPLNARAGSQPGCSRSALFLLLPVYTGKGQVVIRSGMIFCWLCNCSFSSFICIIHLRVCQVIFPRSGS